MGADAIQVAMQRGNINIGANQRACIACDIAGWFIAAAWVDASLGFANSKDGAGAVRGQCAGTAEARGGAAAGECSPLCMRCDRVAI